MSLLFTRLCLQGYYDIRVFSFYLKDHLTSSRKCCQPPVFSERVGVTAGSDGHTLTRLTHSAPESLMGGSFTDSGRSNP